MKGLEKNTKTSYLCRKVEFRTKSNPTKTQSLLYWTGTLTGTHDTNQSGLWMCEVCSATWGRDLSTSKSGMSLFDTIGFVGFSRVSPTRRGPLSPLKAAGPWPLQRWPSKPSSFQLRLPGTLPWSLPPAPSHSAAEITLFILCIIVSSWMQKLCRHSSELN